MHQTPMEPKSDNRMVAVRLDIRMMYNDRHGEAKEITTCIDLTDRIDMNEILSRMGVDPDSIFCLGCGSRTKTVMDVGLHGGMSTIVFRCMKKGCEDKIRAKLSSS